MAKVLQKIKENIKSKIDPELLKYAQPNVNMQPGTLMPVPKSPVIEQTPAEPNPALSQLASQQAVPKGQPIQMPSGPTAEQLQTAGNYNLDKITPVPAGTKAGWLKTPMGWIPEGPTVSGFMPFGPIAPQFNNIMNESKETREANFQAALQAIATTPSTTEAEAQSISPVTAASIGLKAGAGLAGGMAVGGPPGAIAGGAAMALYGISQISADAVQNVKIADTNRKLATNNVKTIINLAEAGKINATEAAIMLRQQEITLRQVEATLKRETKTQVGSELSKGLDEMAKIENYFNFDQYNYKRDLILGLGNPSGKLIALESIDTGENLNG